jgi:hypothetical protein
MMWSEKVREDTFERTVGESHEFGASWWSKVSKATLSWRSVLKFVIGWAPASFRWWLNHRKRISSGGMSVHKHQKELINELTTDNINKWSKKRKKGERVCVLDRAKEDTFLRRATRTNCQRIPSTKWGCNKEKNCHCLPISQLFQMIRLVMTKRFQLNQFKRKWSD